MPYYAGTAASFATVTYFATMMPVEQGQNAIGYLGCAVVASMLGGPLQTIKTVLKEKSTRTLPFPMAVMTLINASLWYVDAHRLISSFVCRCLCRCLSCFLCAPSDNIRMVIIPAACIILITHATRTVPYFLGSRLASL